MRVAHVADRRRLEADVERPPEPLLEHAEHVAQRHGPAGRDVVDRAGLRRPAPASVAANDVADVGEVAQLAAVAEHVDRPARERRPR